jgi:anthranilate synthase component 2
MSSVLIFDNYDSFTYNLVHLVERQLHAKVAVCKNDEYSIDKIGHYKKIILSPGPGLPDEAGLLKQVISTYGPTHSILGVCLGHQAIAEVYGARLINLKNVFHGVATKIVLTESHSVLFKNFPKTFNAGRYHSWVVDEATIPSTLEVLAYDEAGSVMALRHRQFDIHGVQFHPESIMTEYGEKLLHNWLFD